MAAAPKSLSQVLVVPPARGDFEPPPAPGADDEVQGHRELTQIGMVWDGRYQIERTLGEGGMGEVLLARDLAAEGAPVALKVLQARFREVATPYFMREFVMQRRLRHPAIARVHELGFDQQDGSEVPYFSMQFVPGLPLAILLEEQLDLADVWRWTIEVLQALDLVHRMGYLHRDVKPGNILVDSAASGGTAARLIDFGIAVPLSGEREEFFIGTPEYSAPERMACEALDARSDLYSVALILYELIEGEPPWPGWEPEELWVQRMKKPAPPITNPGCPAAVRELIAKALAPDPADRPASAVEFIERLCQAIGERSVLESEVAFRDRLAALPLRTPSYQRAMAIDARVLILEVPAGHDGTAVLHELADRNSVKGVRVVRVRLDGRPDRPLAELEPALDVFRRLRSARTGPMSTAILQGIAGAATMLTRLHRPTVLCIEGLQRADAAILTLLQTVFTGATHEYLNVVATVDLGEAPLAADPFEDFLERDFVRRARFEPLTREDTADFLGLALGAGVLDGPNIDRFHEEAEGSPSRLIQLLTEAFRRGDIRRTLEGYLWLDDALVPNTRRRRHVGADLELYELLSVMRGPLPLEAVERYLGPAWEAERLVESGVLARMASDWVVLLSRPIFDKRYEMLTEARRRGLHQRMGDALVALDAFPGRQALAAEHLELTARPAQAVPYLLAAANDATEHRNEARAIAYVDRAARLAERDPLDDDDRWHWRILLAEAEIQVGRRLGDLERLADAAERLFRLGVDGAHLSSIEHALVAKMDHAGGLGQWARLVEHAEQLLLLHHMSQSGRAVALHRWARALEAWSKGDVEGAFRLTEDGLAGLDADDPATRVKLLTLRAELAVVSLVDGVARRAIEALRRAGVEANDRVATSRAGLMRAAMLRREGKVSEALRAVQAVTAALGASHLRGVNGRVELEFAECHLSLGWHESALEHARRAIDLAKRDYDPSTEFAARASLAEALCNAGELQVAQRALVKALDDLPPHAMPPAVFDARIRFAQVQQARGVSPGVVIDMAGRLASEAARAGDPRSAMRAAAIAARAALRGRFAVEALRYAEWLGELTATYAEGGLPRHTVDWLLACAHYQMRWFNSASALSRRAMEELRAMTQSMVEPEHRRGFLQVRDNALDGIGGLDLGSAPAVAAASPPVGRAAGPQLAQPRAGVDRGAPPALSAPLEVAAGVGPVDLARPAYVERAVSRFP